MLVSPYGEATLWSVRGEARTLRGEYDLAKTDLRRALEAFESIGHAIGETLTLRRMARLEVVSGSSFAAVDQYALVVEQFRAMGMHSEADRTEQERRAISAE